MRPRYLDRFSDAEIDDARAYARDCEVDGYGDVDDRRVDEDEDELDRPEGRPA